MPANNQRLLYESQNSLIYFGSEGGFDEPVVMKILKADYPSPQRIIQFNNEFEFTKDLELDGIRKAFKRAKVDGKYVLYLEYVDGDTVKEAFVGQKKSLSDFLKVAVKTARALADIHQAGIIHKDITAKNILVNEEDEVLKIIDFGISSKVDLKTPHLGNPDKIEGTLAYFSPEQTGRMNRVVDYRSDLYSLGVVFYEMLTGRLPFETRDSLELVHCHIARKPEPLHEIDEEIPQMISNIVARLMEKNAEDRYQSAFGLMKDLETCLQQWEERGRIDVFKLATREESGRFQISERLYGREKEVEKLMQAFDRVSKGGMEMLLVSGYSGVGKSALIQESHKPITAKKGYFITGKYDQYQRNIPYHAITQAFNEYCNYLLTENKEKLEGMRTDILDAVGDYGQVLIEIIPHLELIIGKQPTVERLEPLENINRFNLLFQRFLRAISTVDHPLVLFIDDLQWADAASLNLIKVLSTDDKNQFFLFIGAYRDNEVDDNHPLMRMLDEATEEQARIDHIHLKPLTREHVTDLVTDTLDSEKQYSEELADLVYSKTLGNAFFTIEFLKSLYEKNLISFNHKTHKWQADLKKIRQLDITDNVVDLMTARINKLNEATQQTLQLASCIGNKFDLRLLSVIYEHDIRQTLANLWNAIEEGLIVPADENYKLVSVLNEDELQVDIDLRFLHDRVQQAAYSLIDEKERNKTHLQIGRLILAKKGASEEFVFDICNQLNRGVDLITDNQERLQLAELNLKAARKAKDATANSSALNYLEVGLSLLGSNSWESEYKLTLDISRMAAEVYYLNGDFENSERMISACLAHARGELDQVDIYYTLILRQTMSSQYEEAISAARKALSLLGAEFPAENVDSLIEEEMGFLINYFETQGIEQIYEHKDMTDPEKLATIKILDNLSAPTYVSGQINPWILQAAMKVHLSLDHGNSPETAYAFTELGLICCIQGLFKYGYRCGQLARRLAERYEKRSLRHKSRSLHLIANYINPWYDHIRETDAINNTAFQASMDSGELIFAGYTQFHPFYNWFTVGEPNLKRLLQKIPSAQAFTRKIKHDLAYDSLLAMEFFIRNLQGNTENPTTFSRENLDEATYLTACQEKSEFYGISIFYAFKAAVLYINGFYKEALEANQRAAEIILPLRGNAVNFSTHIFFQSLIYLQLYPEKDKETQATYLQQVEENQKLIKSWMDNCADNFEHQYYLVKAEKNRVCGDLKIALEDYQQSISSAEKHGYIWVEALANELAAKYWIQRDNPMYVRAHFQEARHGYSRWGAWRKVHLLEEAFPKYFTKDESKVRLTNETVDTTTTVTLSSDSSSADLDTISVVKASQALSSEIILDKLLKKMTQIAMENAGATKALLLLEDEGSWKIRARGVVGEDIKVLRSSDSENMEAIPMSVVNYVIRSNEEVLLNDAYREGMFVRDKYFQRYQPQSVICMPLVVKGETKAVLYLENQVSSRAFNSSRMEMLRLLSYQMAVSIENANLYENLRTLNEANARFVPYQFIRTLGHDSITRVSLGDQIQQEMTVLFSDIRDYTTMSESMTPEENFDFINSYLKRVGSIFEENFGFVNQFYGDGIMALFPEPENALKASIQMQRRVDLYNEERKHKGRKPIKIGIGLHTGELMLGIIGDETRHDTGVISNAVNTASRIEGLTKIFGASVLLSEDSLAGINSPDQFHYRYLGSVQVKGRQSAIKVFEFFDGDGPDMVTLKRQTESDFNEGLKYYYDKDFVSAAASLKKVMNVNPDDKAAERYFKNAAHFMVQGVPEDWLGTEIIHNK